MEDICLALGKAPNSVIEEFETIQQDHCSLAAALHTLLSRQTRRTARYDIQPLGQDTRDWNIAILQHEDKKELNAALSELDSYIEKNRLQNRSSGLEDLVCGALDDIAASDLSDVEEQGTESFEEDVSHQSVVFLVMGDAGDNKLMHVDANRDYATGVSTQCIMCESEFSSQDELDVHYETKHTRDVILCPICNEKFYAKTAIQDHCRHHHLRHLSFKQDGSIKISERELTKCPECDYLALKKGRMENHLKEVHHIIEKIACEACGKEFSNHRAMRHHFSQFHTMLNAACEICGKVCKNRSAFQRHQLMHTRRFECGVCGKTFLDRRCFTQHEKLHLSSTKFPCPHCDQTFNQKHNLERHVKVKHLKEGKLVCTDCSFETFYKGVMEKHTERLHLGIRKDKYACQICQKTFSRRLIYSEHMDIHVGIYRYSCTACGKKYRNKGRCKQHTTQCAGASVCENSIVTLENSPRLQVSANEMNIVEIIEDSADEILDGDVLHRALVIELSNT